LLPLLLLFLLLHLLLLGFFFVFLATFVSHARSCSINMTRDGECQTLLSKTSAFLIRRQDPLISEDYSSGLIGGLSGDPDRANSYSRKVLVRLKGDSGAFRQIVEPPLAHVIASERVVLGVLAEKRSHASVPVELGNGAGHVLFPPLLPPVLSLVQVLAPR